MPSYQIIIPCYWVDDDLINSTLNCLNSLKDQLNHVIIVDDGSPLRLKAPLVFPQVIRRENNGGYAKAVNSGLKKSTADILIIANNDLEFIDPHWLDALLSPLLKYDICSIRTTDADGWTVEDRLEENAKFGSLWAMRREVYETIGPLSVFGKGYFEDLDYQKRATDAGFRVVKNHAGLAEHQPKSTFSKVDPEDKEYLKSMQKFQQKWGRVW